MREAGGERVQSNQVPASGEFEQGLALDDRVIVGKGVERLDQHAPVARLHMDVASAPIAIRPLASKMCNRPRRRPSQANSCWKVQKTSGGTGSS